MNRGTVREHLQVNLHACRGEAPLSETNSILFKALAQVDRLLTGVYRLGLGAHRLFFQSF